MLIHKAIEFAAKVHDGQLRKGTDVPYIVHPFEVAQILTKENCSEDVIIAGLLHDIVEDTDVSLIEIEEKFGVNVSKLVAKCTEDKRKSWQERKQHTIDILGNTVDYNLLMLHCADKTANLRSFKADIEKQGDEIWNRFNATKEQIAWYYSNMNDLFSPLSETEVYWENTNLFQDIFVAYYINVDEDLIIQESASGEVFYYFKNAPEWLIDEEGMFKSLIDNKVLIKINNDYAYELEKQWHEKV